jgi:phosphatidylethanolamine-binding protein (PEBP) family uncharacterized protein
MTLSWRRLTCIALASVGAISARAHTIGNAQHDAVLARFAREFGPTVFAQVSSPNGPATAFTAATMFQKFAPRVVVRAEQDFLWVESNGLPAHNLMVGITAWQQQVPLPQPYTGANAWRIPLHPQPSPTPAAIKDRFLRGAIALAANGIPIFNPQNNRGEISAEIGELDQWGGHCGRADDYHYHLAPLHLQATLGPALPIACALDGYPIYGLTEPDGKPPGKLDSFNGHETASLGYHYHASTKYPYVNGGFHGVVIERDEQVDPQPRAQGIRPALTALRGARIVGFEGVPGKTACKLSYTVNGKQAAITYQTMGGGQWRFQFANTDGTAREEVYRAGDREGGGGREGKKKAGGLPPERPRPPEAEKQSGAAADFVSPRSGNFTLRSPAVGSDGVLPIEFTGDGASLSPPLEWQGAPAETRSFAVIMHHVAPDGELKWYWTLYNIPASVTSVPRDARDIGTLGNNSVTRRAGYAPPHSKGPGEKTYVLTAYALSAPVTIAATPAQVNRAALLVAMKDLILDSAELKVTYTRPAGGTDDGPPRQKGNR